MEDKIKRRKKWQKEIDDAFGVICYIFGDNIPSLEKELSKALGKKIKIKEMKDES